MRTPHAAHSHHFLRTGFVVLIAIVGLWLVLAAGLQRMDQAPMLIPDRPSLALTTTS